MTAPASGTGTPGQAATLADDWGVVVNEAKIFATRGGDGWWVDYLRTQPQERVTCLKIGVAGGTWHVACDSNEDSEMLIEAMAENGINPKFLKVARLSAVRHGERTPPVSPREALYSRLIEAFVRIRRCDSSEVVCVPCQHEINEVMEAADAYADADRPVTAAAAAQGASGTQPSNEVIRAAFLSFMASQGYDDQGTFDQDEMELAFETGMFVQAGAPAAPAAAPEPADAMADTQDIRDGYARLCEEFSDSPQSGQSARISLTVLNRHRTAAGLKPRRPAPAGERRDPFMQMREQLVAVADLAMALEAEAQEDIRLSSSHPDGTSRVILAKRADSLRQAAARITSILDPR